jgi:tRNA modification GTPase
MTGASPRCALLTPPGRGAVATIGVRGTRALAAVAQCFQPASGQPLADVPPGRVVFGRFQLLHGPPEELVVGLNSSEEVEVHCHGGSAAAEAILSALVAAGCEVETWRERATADECDPIAAAALVALADARTERTAAILLDQYHGALRRELDEIRELIACDSRQALERLQALLAKSGLGRHLTRPWRVVLTGAPNVGKSSLINALLGYQRAIVAGQPGTTRDVLTATTALGGWPVELADTAGLRTGGDAIEVEGVARARRQIAEADLVIDVRDSTAGVGSRESGVGDRQAQSQTTLVVFNKCDLLMPAPGSSILAISAKTGQGIDALMQAIVQQLVPSPPPRGAAVPFTESQIAALEQAQAHLIRGNQRAAHEAIESLAARILNPEP